MEKNKFQFTEEALENAISQMCDELYNFDPQFKCEMHFWKNGEISVSGLMSKNSDIIWRESPVWTYYQTASYADDETPEDVTKGVWFDFIKDEIYEYKPENIEII